MRQTKRQLPMAIPILHLKSRAIRDAAGLNANDRRSDANGPRPCNRPTVEPMQSTESVSVGQHMLSGGENIRSGEQSFHFLSDLHIM
jgi:hypothetical protein